MVANVIIQPPAALLSCRSFARLAAAHLLVYRDLCFEGLRGVLIDCLRTDLMLTGLAIDSLLFTGPPSPLRACSPARDERELVATGNRNRRADHGQVTTILEWGGESWREAAYADSDQGNFFGRNLSNRTTTRL